MDYHIEPFRDYYAIVDDCGRIVETFDFGEYNEAKEVLATMLHASAIPVSCLVAKAKWVTRSKRRIFVPCEEFRREFHTVKAHTLEEARRVLTIKLGDNHIIRDLRAE